MLAQKLSEILYTGKRQQVHVDCFGVLHPFESLRRKGKTSDSSNKSQGPSPLRPGSEYFLFCRVLCRILPLKCWPGSENFLFCRFFCRILPPKCWPSRSMKVYIRANDSQFTSTDLAVFVHLSHFKTTARRPIQVTNYSGRVPLGQEANIFCVAVSFAEYCRRNVDLEAQ